MAELSAVIVVFAVIHLFSAGLDKGVLGVLPGIIIRAVFFPIDVDAEVYAFCVEGVAGSAAISVVVAVIVIHLFSAGLDKGVVLDKGVFFDKDVEYSNLSSKCLGGNTCGHKCNNFLCSSHFLNFFLIIIIL